MMINRHSDPVGHALSRSWACSWEGDPITSTLSGTKSNLDFYLHLIVVVFNVYSLYMMPVPTTLHTTTFDQIEIAFRFDELFYQIGQICDTLSVLRLALEAGRCPPSATSTSFQQIDPIGPFPAEPIDEVPYWEV